MSQIQIKSTANNKKVILTEEALSLYKNILSIRNDFEPLYKNFKLKLGTSVQEQWPYKTWIEWSNVMFL